MANKGQSKRFRVWSSRFYYSTSNHCDSICSVSPRDGFPVPLIPQDWSNKGVKDGALYIYGLSQIFVNSISIATFLCFSFSPSQRFLLHALPQIPPLDRNKQMRSLSRSLSMVFGQRSSPSSYPSPAPSLNSSDPALSPVKIYGNHLAVISILPPSPPPTDIPSLPPPSYASLERHYFFH